MKKTYSGAVRDHVDIIAPFFVFTCVLVCRMVCRQENTKTPHQTSMTLGWMMGHNGSE